MEKNTSHSPIYADDATEGVSLLLKLRVPWLIVGLFGGVLASVVVARFETALAEDIHLAFFIPIIVYMSDAVGTQTETIFVRNLGQHKIKIGQYVAKEFALGIIMGLLFGAIVGVIARYWLNDVSVGWTVGLAMFINVTLAPMIALLIPTLLMHRRTDPALGAGPFTTVVQDVVSLLVYFTVASFILFR